MLKSSVVMSLNFHLSPRKVFNVSTEQNIPKNRHKDVPI
jgi:hypothetical protein